MRESNENGRFLASRPATSLTDPTASQRLKPPLRNPHAAFSKGEGQSSAIGRIAMPPAITGAEMTHSLRKKVVAIPLAITPIGSAVAKLVVAEQGGLALGAPLAAQVKAVDASIDRRHGVYTQHVDLDRPKSISEFFKIAIGQFGHLDVIMIETIKSSTRNASVEKIIELSLRRLLHCLDAALPYIEGDLHIINIAPAAGRFRHSRGDGILGCEIGNDGPASDAKAAHVDGVALRWRDPGRRVTGKNDFASHEGTAVPRRYGNSASPPRCGAAAARQARSRAIKNFDAYLRNGSGRLCRYLNLGPSFSWFASIAARVRFGRCNFCSTAVTCRLTVFKEQERSSAISRLLLPAATSSSTSRCRGLRLSTPACACDVLAVSLVAGLNCLANAFAIVS